MKDKVLIVDDIEINRIILREILSEDYDIVEAGNGMDAVDIMYTSGAEIQAVLLDIMMPGMDGFEVLKKLKENETASKVPVLFITAADADTNETRGLIEGAVDYISKPFNPEVVKARVDNQIQLKKYRSDLESMVEQKTSELTATHEHILETLATIIEYRSLESGAHTKRTSELTKILIEYLIENNFEFAKDLIEQNYKSIIKAVSLHDIGKVGIPDSILLKPGKLTSEEFDVIKQHTIIGGDIIESINEAVTSDSLYLQHCKDICLYHHERWDGKGYPNGLKGEEIPLSARIVAVVDVYDALVNNRCYKPSFGHEKAVGIISEASGTQFDARIVEAFLAEQYKFQQLEEELKDD